LRRKREWIMLLPIGNASKERTVIRASGYTNGDDIFLAWLLPRTPDCWGVSLWREVKRPSGKVSSGFVENRVGFAVDKPTPHSHRPSNEWPFQRYTWTDHGVDEGDRVTYTITPMLERPSGLRPETGGAATVGPLRVTSAGGSGSAAYFNRGVLLSQFMAKKLGPEFTSSDLKRLKESLSDDDSELRDFLRGQLGDRLVRLVDDAKATRSHVYAALYELEDPELIQRLKSLGSRAHVVLSNGSKKKRNEDGNAEAAEELTGVVDLHRRMLWSEGLGHNKFLVVAKPKTNPLAVWTGSTNWATTGLCTQLNNGLLVEDPGLARIFLDQWKLLRDDRRTGPQGQDLHFGEKLMEQNDLPKSLPGNRRSVWFTRTSAGQDLEAVSELINGAKDAILFLMFEPGANGLLQVVQARLSPASATYREGLYVHGVVNTLKQKPAGTRDDVDVELVGRGSNRPFRLTVIEPQGATGLAGWADEVTRRDFLLSQGGAIGHAIIHSKIIVLDPFTKPVVITGSHNYSQSASSKNDENICIVAGDKRLAERYAVNIMSTYQHYRWRAYLQECARLGRSPWKGLVKSASWQRKQPEHDSELQFWVRT